MSVRSAVYTALVLAIVAWGTAASAGQEAVALQTAAPSCADDSGNRYVDCENGTVTDSQTGLIWLANANCFGKLLDWRGAMAAVAGLSDFDDCEGQSPDACDCGLSDVSSPGEWRLPSKEEWKLMTEPARALGCQHPAINDDAGDGCWTQECVDKGACSFYGVQPSGWYWSSSPDVRWADLSVWAVWLGTGGAADAPPSGVPYYIWPVRGGQ